MKKNNYRETAVAVIINSKKEVLLALNPRINSIDKKYVDFNTYKFPQGGIEKGETKLDAIIREMKEELGITLNKDYQILQSFPESISYWFKNEEKPDFEIKLFPFLLVLLDDTYKFNCDPEEVSEIKWIDPNKVKNLNLGIRKEAYLKILSLFNLTSNKYHL